MAKMVNDTFNIMSGALVRCILINGGYWNKCYNMVNGIGSNNTINVVGANNCAVRFH